MERHYEIWGGHQDDPDSDEFLETVVGYGDAALQSAINITRYYHVEGFYAYIKDMDNGEIVIFA